jgi:membrane-bound lytic murein transglycosylase D
MRFFAVALIFFGVAASYAQTPQVPHKMRFADMTLTIRDDARREIQKDVDALTKSPKYFGIKVERARTYFPIIEKIFEEERLPLDFKYLVLQESALIPDAVSVSNAVGFWQFKDFTAMEMGLRVDKTIDERMNIVSSSRAAAKYIKQNNFMFNNWIYALQAYQMGAGGVKRVVGDEHNGARHMDITSETYWYVKKFLAHKVAFEDAMKHGEPQLKMQVFPIQEEKSLSELAKQMAIDEVELYTYNRWIKNGKIPGDRTYAVVVPNGKVSPEFGTMVAATVAKRTNEIMDRAVSPTIVKKEINGIIAVKGMKGESTTQLASRLNVNLSDFLKYNDIKIDHAVREDVYYFTKKKKNKSSELTHTASRGEDLWYVSQYYGVSLKKIQRLNSSMGKEKLAQGDVVYLNSKRPASSSPTSGPQPEPVVAAQVIASSTTNDAYFDWVVDTNVKEVADNTKSAKAEIKKKEIVTPAAQSPENQQATTVSELSNGVHVVTAGETLYSISKKYQVNVVDLLEWNELDITAGLKPGQQLKVQSQNRDVAKQNTEVTTNTGMLVTHEVKPSDTLYSVARQYNVSIKEIMDWNNKQDFSLTLGEKLKIFAR